MKTHLQLTVLFVSISFVSAFSQQSFTTTGKTLSGSGGSVSYSVGQPFVLAFGNENITVSPGVQQPYEISVETSIGNADEIELYFKAYPNPVTDRLFLSGEADEFKTLTYQLFDISGKVLESNNITQNPMTIEVAHLPSSTYFLRLDKKGEPVKTFKIIKAY